MAFYIAFWLFVIGLGLWVVQHLIGTIARAYVTLNGSDEDRQVLAQTSSILVALGMMVRAIKRRRQRLRSLD